MAGIANLTPAIYQSDQTRTQFGTILLFGSVFNESSGGKVSEILKTGTAWCGSTAVLSQTPSRLDGINKSETPRRVENFAQNDAIDQKQIQNHLAGRTAGRRRPGRYDRCRGQRFHSGRNIRVITDETHKHDTRKHNVHCIGADITKCEIVPGGGAGALAREKHAYAQRFSQRHCFERLRFSCDGSGVRAEPPIRRHGLRRSLKW